MLQMAGRNLVVVSNSASDSDQLAVRGHGDTAQK
jgi:hypothetical protein